jgi:hypothetical protein
VAETAFALLAATIAQPANPARAVLELLTLDLDHVTFHSMLASTVAFIINRMFEEPHHCKAAGNSLTAKGREYT